MKKSIILLALVLFGFSPIWAQAIEEQQSVVTAVEINIAVMAGPTGFSSVSLPTDKELVASGSTVNLTVFPSPNEVIARLANGELDIAALPSNLASILYNKGVKVKVAAVIGYGNLSLVGTDPAMTSVNGILGKSVNIPGAGSTPDQLSKLLLQKSGLTEGTDVVLDYSVAAPAQVAQMLIANKISLAVLPEPFVSMVLSKNPKAKVIADIQNLYSELAGVPNYPMTTLVVSDKFAKQHPGTLDLVLSAYKKSVAWVNANPVDAGKAIEAAGILSAALATPAIPSCNLVYVASQEAKTEVLSYYTFLHSLSPAAIGGKVPGSDLFL